MDSSLSFLLDDATLPFRRAGRVSWHYARGKLRHDPVYFALLRSGVLPDAGMLVDLGCGQGILFALLAAAREQFERGRWPSGWPAPPGRLAMRGYDLRDRSIRAGSAALDGKARLERRDIRGLAIPSCSAVVVLDVLYHLAPPEQERVLEAAASALEPGGVLVLRESNAGGGMLHRLQRCSEYLAQAWRGSFVPRLWYRDARDWESSLRRLGLDVRTQPMNGRTPFANVLFFARRRA
jgi:SAM-dependent methyltransferase